jgi:hypothetical protein
MRNAAMNSLFAGALKRKPPRVCLSWIKSHPEERKDKRLGTLRGSLEARTSMRDAKDAKATRGKTGLLGRFAELAAKGRASPTRPPFRPTCGDPGPLRQRELIRNATDSAERELPTAPPPPLPRSPSWGGKPLDRWIVRNFAELRTSWAQSKPSQHSLGRP